MRRLAVSAALLFLTSCTGEITSNSSSSAVDTADHHGGPGGHDGRSDIHLHSADTHALQLDETAWTFAKTGSVNTAKQTVTWTITATRGSTTTGQLIVDGYLVVTNDGDGPATIGNIVVDLQTMHHPDKHHHDKPGWVAVSTDIADATSDDNATTAHVIVDDHGHATASLVSEDAASGHLLFMDATNNTVFSLVPEQTVPARTSMPLLFSASFDNTVLHLAPDTHARAEVTVTFGNSSGHGDASGVDINGNGVIDADEDAVRSVSTTRDVTIPKPKAVNQDPTITDGIADLVVTGTVALSNPVFDLGATSGTVSVQFDGGPAGGSVTNCAHLDSPGTTTKVGGYTFNDLDGIHLTACNTETVKPSVCTPGSPGCGWQTGQLVTYGQGIWGGDPTLDAGAELLAADFNTVYSATGELVVGSPSGYTMSFDDSSSVLAYQPSIGPYGALDGSVLDPISTASGAFGGDVLALELNVDFTDAGVLHGSSSDRFGDLTLCGLTSLQAPVNGESIRQFLANMNTLLSGGTAVLAISDLGTLVGDVNASFSSGTPSTFAQLHVVAGSCP